MLCFGCLDNWNVINGGHSEPGSCGCRHSASPNAASTCYRGDGNRVRLQVTCTPCPVAARGGKCCREAETVLYGVQFHTLLRVARAAEQLGSGYGFVGLQPGACPRRDLVPWAPLDPRVKPAGRDVNRLHRLARQTLLIVRSGITCVDAFGDCDRIPEPGSNSGGEREQHAAGFRSWAAHIR